jgi:UDP-GlcNAc:undecaprenyl-phosphate GlcNAc-1-phosphate transferase
VTSPSITFLLPFLVATLAAMALTPLARRLSTVIGAIDQPGARKVHRVPMPRLGGVAVLGAMAVTFLLLWVALPQHPVRMMEGKIALGAALGLLPILLISLIDDIRPLPAGPKFAAHALGAAIAVGSGVCLAPTVHLFDHPVYIGVLAVPLSMVWIVGVTNAFNIVDGLDGLSAGLALVSACSLAAIFTISNQPDMAAASLVVAGALVGFLPYNLHPASIFLGDTGATAIGFCLGCFALRGGATLTSGFAALLPVFFLGLPIADMAVSMARRFILRHEQPNGHRIYEADQNHFHHRLLARGASHRKAVFILYGAGLFIAAAALLSILLKAFEAGLLLLSLVVAGFVGIARLGYEEFAMVRSGVVFRFHHAPALRRSFFAVFVDVLMVVVAAHVALVLKVDNWATPGFISAAVRMVATVTPLTIVTFWSLGLYRGYWRLAGNDDFFRLGLAVLTSTVVAYLAHQQLFAGSGQFSVFVIYALVELTMAYLSRVMYRVIISQRDLAQLALIPVLIYGAGVKEGEMLTRVLADGSFGMRPVGFIDDDPALSGRRVNDLPVWGDLRALELAVARTSARKLIVAHRNVTPDRLVAAQFECERAGVELAKMSVQFDAVPDPAPLQKARTA